MTVTGGPKLTRRTQIMLTDEQHRWLTIRARHMDASLAAVIRQLLDEEMKPAPDLMNDPAIRFLLSPPVEGGEWSSSDTIDQEIYGDPELNQ